MINTTQEFKDLISHATEMKKLALRDLLANDDRCRTMVAKYDGIVLDYSRQRLDAQTTNKLFDLCSVAQVVEKIAAMRRGDKINTSEQRAVAHMALRGAVDDVFMVEGKNVIEDVEAVRAHVREFSENVRRGVAVGHTGRRLTDVVAIGIGGSFLGGEFVNEALRTEPAAAAAADGRRLRFLANVDPVDVKRALDGLKPDTTLVIIISKTFTTAETMLNAKTVRGWIVEKLGEAAVGKHMVAVSTNIEGVKTFGIDEKNIFAFWDWVGGRYSVTSAVGLLPLALQYGYEVVDQFLAGARSIDRHFVSAPPRENLPIILGMCGVWNSTFMGLSSRCLSCYSQALHRFAAHIQQVDMESNGKRVTTDGVEVPFATGEVNFGEPGTNGQHSYFQLLHQGREVAVDFIGTCASQNPVRVPGEPVSNHDELMANFFAQPDALACGISSDELKDNGVPAALIPHKVMPGNRPSNVLLLPALNAYTTGQLLALYEHRTAVQGFVWGVNSFDQMGVELGKVLASRVRRQMTSTRNDANAPVQGFNASTTALLNHYFASSL